MSYSSSPKRDKNVTLWKYLRSAHTLRMNVEYPHNQQLEALFSCGTPEMYFYQTARGIKVKICIEATHTFFPPSAHISLFRLPFARANPRRHGHSLFSPFILYLTHNVHLPYIDFFHLPLIQSSCAFPRGKEFSCFMHVR